MICDISNNFLYSGSHKYLAKKHGLKKMKNVFSRDPQSYH